MHSLQLSAYLFCVALTTLHFPASWAVITCKKGATPLAAGKTIINSCVIIVDVSKTLLSSDPYTHYTADTDDCNDGVKEEACSKVSASSNKKFVYCCKENNCDATVEGTSPATFPTKIDDIVAGLQSCQKVKPVECEDLTKTGVAFQKNDVMQLSGKTCVGKDYKLGLFSSPQNIKSMTCDAVKENGLTLKKEEAVKMTDDATCELKFKSDSSAINEVACVDIKTKGVTLKKDQYLKLTGTCETSYQLVLPSPPKKVKQLTCDIIIENGMTLKKDEYVHLNDGTCTLKSCTKSGGKLMSSLLAVVMSVMAFSSHKLM